MAEKKKMKWAKASTPEPKSVLKKDKHSLAYSGSSALPEPAKTIVGSPKEPAKKASNKTIRNSFYGKKD